MWLSRIGDTPCVKECTIQVTTLRINNVTSVTSVGVASEWREEGGFVPCRVCVWV